MTFDNPTGTRGARQPSANALVRWVNGLAAHPDRARIELDGQSVEVTAEQLHGDEREQAWAAIVASAPRFAKYAEGTDRLIPVIRLQRR